LLPLLDLRAFGECRVGGIRRTRRRWTGGSRLHGRLHAPALGALLELGDLPLILLELLHQLRRLALALSEGRPLLLDRFVPSLDRLCELVRELLFFLFEPRDVGLRLLPFFAVLRGR